MHTMELRLPQLGEGLREARIVHLLKSPGDAVARDECIYTVETDKAEMEVESPVDGVLEAWRVREDEFVPVGDVVVTLQTDAAAVDMEEAPATPDDSPAQTPGQAPAVAPSRPQPVLSNRVLPPRMRAYARQKGLSDDDLVELAEGRSKITQPDVDDLLAARRMQVIEEKGAKIYPMPHAQRIVAERLAHSYRQVVPASIEVVLRWRAVRAARDAVARVEGLKEVQPSSFLVASWCVAQAAKAHPKFRSTLLDNHRVRESDHVTLGIAVSRPDDELVSAVIPEADTLELPAFVRAARTAIDTARAEGDQAVGQTIHVALSNMGSYDIRSGVPIVMAPSVATIVFASSYLAILDKQSDAEEVVSMVIGFDHRWINGVAAANFAKTIRERIEHVDFAQSPRNRGSM